MVAVENDRCLLFEDHVQGELMALMGVDEAAYSTRNNPISVERGPLRDYAPEAGVQPNDLHSDGALLLYHCMRRRMTKQLRLGRNCLTR